MKRIGIALGVMLLICAYALKMRGDDVPPRSVTINNKMNQSLSVKLETRNTTEALEDSFNAEALPILTVSVQKNGIATVRIKPGILVTAIIWQGTTDGDQYKIVVADDAQPKDGDIFYINTGGRYRSNFTGPAEKNLYYKTELFSGPINSESQNQTSRYNRT